MRKKSKYKPKGVRVDNLAWVLQGFKKLPELEHTNIVVRAKNHGAMKSMVDGTGTRDDCDIIIGALNMCEAMMSLGFGTDWRDEIHEGHAALLSMARRGHKTGRFLFTGPELTAVNLAMAVHDAQLDEATVIDLEKGLDIVNKIIANRTATRIVEEEHA